MAECGTWHLSMTDEIQGAFNYGFCLLPTGEAGQTTSIIGGENIGICAGCADEAECVAFIEWLCSRENETAWALGAGKLPTRRARTRAAIQGPRRCITLIRSICIARPESSTGRPPRRGSRQRICGRRSRHAVPFARGGGESHYASHQGHSTGPCLRASVRRRGLCPAWREVRRQDRLRCRARLWRRPPVARRHVDVLLPPD